MNQTDAQNHIRNSINHFFHHTSRLNLYVQNAKSLDLNRVAAELRQLKLQLDELLRNVPTNFMSVDDDLNSFNGTVVKALLKFEERIEQLENRKTQNLWSETLSSRKR
jgi:hypothetical protein